MRKPDFDINIFAERRAQLLRKIQGGALILASRPELNRNADNGYLYRQDSNLFYLTGFEEPGAILVLIPGHTPETIMFVRPRDKDKETWNGFRYGPEGVEREFGIEKAYPIDEFAKLAPELIEDAGKVYYRLFFYKEMDAIMADVLEQARIRGGRTGKGLQTIVDPSVLLGEMRLIKSAAEMQWIETACDIGTKAHMAAMNFVRPGVNEREVYAVLLHAMMINGASGESFNAIVASGNNATTLHYCFNDQPCLDGDLLLIDAGAEYKGYASDITRTFPINGKFAPAQRALYQGVLDVQKRIIEMIRPGISLQVLRESTVNFLVEVMLDLGLFTGRAEEIISAKDYVKYYPHNVSHWLGLDVHDVGLYKIDGDFRVLEPGMVLTVEPGLYIPKDSDAPSELRGNGVRIEDDILVTRQGYEILTGQVPKEIKELEK